jgi:transcriptional regulator with XRE-family HTH domain
MQLPITFGKRLLEFLDLSGVHQAAVARELGLSRSHVSSWYIGRRRVLTSHYQMLMPLANRVAFERMNALTRRGDPITAETLQADRSWYEALRSLLDERREVLHQVLDTIANACQTIAAESHTIPVAQWPELTQDRIAIAGAELVAYSQARKEFGAYEVTMLETHCEAMLERLTALEETISASENC